MGKWKKKWILVVFIKPDRLQKKTKFELRKIAKFHNLIILWNIRIMRTARVLIKKNSRSQTHARVFFRASVTINNFHHLTHQTYIRSMHSPVAPFRLMRSYLWRLSAWYTFTCICISGGCLLYTFANVAASRGAFASLAAFRFWTSHRWWSPALCQWPPA